MSNALALASGYLARGWNPIPVPYRKKDPRGKAWQKVEQTEATLPQYFNGRAQNVGVQFGPKSHGLTDVDLDCPEAIALARYFLPNTDSYFGRKSKPVSHLLYYIDNAPDSAVVKLTDVTPDGRRGAVIIELRMGGCDKGAQTIFPGSVHDSGEIIEWAKDGEPAKSSFKELRAAINKIAIATILIRAYPPKGSRHDAALALGGFLARAGWEVKDIGNFVEIVRLVTGMGNAPGEDPSNLKRAAIDAAKTHASGGRVYGLPELTKYFGGARAIHVAKILGYDGERPEIDTQWSYSDDQVIRMIVEAEQRSEPTATVETEAKPPPQPQQQPKGSNPRRNGVVRVCANDIVIKPKQWLWTGHLLRGAQELLSGLPGLGKSQLQIDLIARVSKGLPWPNGDKAIAPANVIMMTAEDTLDQEVVPRLRAAGANLERVHILKGIKVDGKDRQFLLGEDLLALEGEVAEVGDVALITLDPITAYMGGTLDSHKTTEVRSQLGPLKDFAERLNVAVSTITHPAKNTSQKAIDQFIGSQAFIAAGRIGHVCIKEFTDDEEGKATGRILFTHAKHNPSIEMPTLAFRVAEVTVGQDDERNSITAPHVVWDKDAVNITADEAVQAARAASDGGKKSTEQKEAQAFLKETLAGAKPIAARDIYATGATLGFSEDQLKRAKAKLRGIISEKTGEGWTWQLPM
jgi:putative DNA primase/helicase